MKKETIGKTVIYTFENGTQFMDMITLSHLSFFPEAATGKTDMFERKICFNDIKSTPIVGKPFYCLLTKEMEVEAWEY